MTCDHIAPRKCANRFHLETSNRETDLTSLTSQTGLNASNTRTFVVIWPCRTNFLASQDIGWIFWRARIFGRSDICQKFSSPRPSLKKFSEISSDFEYEIIRKNKVWENPLQEPHVLGALRRYKVSSVSRSSFQMKLIRAIFWRLKTRQDSLVALQKMQKFRELGPNLKTAFR